MLYFEQLPVEWSRDADGCKMPSHVFANPLIVSGTTVIVASHVGNLPGCVSDVVSRLVTVFVSFVEVRSGLDF